MANTCKIYTSKLCPVSTVISLYIFAVHYKRKKLIAYCPHIHTVSEPLEVAFSQAEIEYSHNSPQTQKNN